MSESIMSECDRCEETFQSKTAMKNHQRRIHGKATPVRCDICGKDYADTSAKNKHSKVVHNSGDVLAHCKVCEKPFYQKSTLKAHLENHCEAVPFPCTFPECTVKVKNNQSLKVHLRMHTVFLANKTTKEVSCQKCDAKFSSKGNYERHYKSKHLNRSDFHCQLCDYNVKEKRTLDKHLKSVKHLKEEVKQQKCRVNLRKLRIKV